MPARVIHTEPIVPQPAIVDGINRFCREVLDEYWNDEEATAAKHRIEQQVAEACKECGVND